MSEDEVLLNSYPVKGFEELQFVNVYPVQSTGLLGNLLVMGEENQLVALPQFSQYLQGGCRPGIVKVDQDIIDNKGHGPTFFRPVLQAGQPQGKVQLVATACGHGLHAKGCLLPVAANTDQYRLAPAIHIDRYFL